MPINRLRKKRRENEINKKVLPRKQNEHDHLVPGNTIGEGPSQEILYLTLGLNFFIRLLCVTNEGTIAYYIVPHA